MLVSAERLAQGLERIELTLPRAMELKIKNTFGVEEILVKQSGKDSTLKAENGYFIVKGNRGKVVLAKK